MIHILGEVLGGTFPAGSVPPLSYSYITIPSNIRWDSLKGMPMLL